MEIRQLASADWPDVRRIYQLGIDTNLATFETSLPAWDSWDANHFAAPRLVAVNDGRIVGFAALSPISKRACYSGVAEVSIYVDAGSKGTGRALMTELVVQSEATGFWTLQSSIFSENIPSVRLHEAAGFRYVGKREKIAQRQGQWKDTLLYERRSLTEPFVFQASIDIDASMESVRQTIATGNGSFGNPLHYSISERNEGCTLHLRNEAMDPKTQKRIVHASPLLLLAIKHCAESKQAGFHSITISRGSRVPNEMVFQRLWSTGKVTGIIRLMDPAGYAAIQTGDSLLCVFSEKSGADSTLTIFWLLCGTDASRVLEFEKKWSAVADRVTQ